MNGTQSNVRVRRIRTRLGELHTRTTGEGPFCMLWSSMFVDSHTWDKMLPLLPSTHTYVLVDPPGLGLSAPLARRTTIAEAANAATDLLDGLGVDGPIDWLGNALGGHVGLKLAARPGILRTLVAVSAPAEPIGPALRAKINVLLPAIRAFGATSKLISSAVSSAMLTDASAADPRIRDVVTDSLARPARASLIQAVHSFILDRTDVSSELAAVDVPSLFVASDGRGDWSPEDAVASAGLASHATAITISGARTLIPLEQPEALASAIERFWSDSD